MKINKADIVAVHGRRFTSWKEIMQLVTERAAHRQAVLDERRMWGQIQAVVGMEE